MKEKWQRRLSQTWAQAGLVFSLALLSRLVALSRPIHHNEFIYALRARNLLLHLTETAQGPLPGMGSFRAITLMWESAALLLLRYWLHVTRIWPSSLSNATSLQQFAAFETTHPMEILLTMRLSTVLTSALGTMLVYLLSRRLWGWRSAALVTAFVSLDPFFLGFSRLLNTDGHVATWTGVALLAFLVYLQQGGYRPAGITVLATALALLSKPSAILLVGFLPLAAVGYGLAMGGTRRQEARRAMWGVLVIGGVVLVWQGVAWLTGRGEDFFTALWQTLNGYMAHPGELKFLLGKTSYSPAWTFYPVVLLARTTPGVMAGMLLGAIALFKTKSRGGPRARPPKGNREGCPYRSPYSNRVWLKSVGGSSDFSRWERLKASLLVTTTKFSHTHSNMSGSKKVEWREEVARWVILASFVVLFVAFISLAKIKIDRYLLPAYPALGIMGARGLQLFWRWAKGRYPSLLLKAGLVSLAFAHLVGALITFPYYTTYYSPFLGKRVVDFIQIGYGEGLGLVADYLNRKPDAERLNVLSWYGREVMGPRFRGTTWQPQAVYGDFVVTAENLHLPSFLTADYVVTYINQIQRKLPDPRLTAYFQSRRPEMEVWLSGLRYAAVYPGPIYGGSVPEEAVSLTYPPAAPLRLLAYQLEEASDAEGYAITLFWQTATPLAQNYTVVIKLLTADGQVWGDSTGWPVGGLLPTTLWEPDVVVRDDHRLRPLPGTPPGTYLLEVTMVDSVTGQPFPLTSGEVGPGGGLVLQTTTLEHPMPPRPDEDPAASVEVPRQRNPAKGIKWLGYSPASWQKLRPGESLSLTLLWQATRTAPPDTSLRWQLTDNGSTTVELGTTVPGTERYPLSRWQKRETVRDQLTLRLPARLESGTYQLRALLPDGTVLEMGTVEVVARQHTFDVPPIAHPLDVAFGDVARLLGYDLDLSSVQAGGPAQLTLYWQAQKEVETAYKVFVHLLDESGQIVTQVDREPQAGAAPTTGWLPGEVVVDEIEIPVTDEVVSARTIAIGLYDPRNGQRLQIAESAQPGETAQVKGDYLTIRVAPK